PHPAHLNPTGDLSVSSLQQNLLLQQFSRWGPWLCIPHRGIHFLTQALIFSVGVAHSLHFSPSSWAASRNFLHLEHQAASSTAATSQGTAGFFSSSCEASATERAKPRQRTVFQRLMDGTPI